MHVNLNHAKGSADLARTRRNWAPAVAGSSERRAFFSTAHVTNSRLTPKLARTDRSCPYPGAHKRRTDRSIFIIPSHSYHSAEPGERALVAGSHDGRLLWIRRERRRQCGADAHDAGAEDRGHGKGREAYVHLHLAWLLSLLPGILHTPHTFHPFIHRTAPHHRAAPGRGRRGARRRGAEGGAGAVPRATPGPA